MWTKRHETLIRRYYDVLSANRLDELDSLMASAFVEHETLPGIPPTRDGLKQKYALLRSGFSDLRFSVDDLFQVGGRVAARVTVSGTHDGNFMGRPPTGRRFAVNSVDIFRVDGDCVVEHWGVFDQMGMLAQLGALPGNPAA